MSKEKVKRQKSFEVRGLEFQKGLFPEEWFYRHVFWRFSNSKKQWFPVPQSPLFFYDPKKIKNNRKWILLKPELKWRIKQLYKKLHD